MWPSCMWVEGVDPSDFVCTRGALCAFTCALESQRKARAGRVPAGGELSCLHQGLKQILHQWGPTCESTGGADSRIWLWGSSLVMLLHAPRGVEEQAGG